MKKFSKILSVALLVALVLSLGVANAFAANGDPSYGTVNTHIITIDNTDQNVRHTYEAYQVFQGNLNAEEGVLSDIVWGEGVNAHALVEALVKANVEQNGKLEGKLPSLHVADSEADPPVVDSTAAEVAEALSVFTSTSGAQESAGDIDAVAAIIADNLATKAAEFAPDSTGKQYTAQVSGDGYYFIKDTTADAALDGENGSDSASKYLLSIIKDTTIIAKDTGITPNKQILKDQGKETETTVAADSAAIGDVVTFEVTVQVPNTAKYENHFVFIMNDQLEAGLTFTGIESVKVTKNETDYSPAYTLYVKEASETAFPTTPFAGRPTDFDAVAAPGGQGIKLVFNGFKAFAEADRDNSVDGVQNLIGNTIVLRYTAVVNDDAEYQATANENEVYFDFSNNPNHDYNGDEFGPDEPRGTTPKSKTRTYTTSLKVLKVDEKDKALAGATFELKGTSLNRTVITGYKFEPTSYTATGEEQIETDTKYWKLKDGSFTKTPPTTDGINTTQYVEGFAEYYRVVYTFDEVSTKTEDIVLVTDADGVAEFVGLGEGTYTLEEINSPDGYNKIDGVSTITVTWSDPEDKDAQEPAKSQGGFTFTEANGQNDKPFGIQWNAKDKQFEVTIQNHSGTQLPSTGGIGTTIFYVVGGVLVLAAIILLVTKKRMSE